MRLQIERNLDEAYTVSDLEGDLVPEVARSLSGLRTILRVFDVLRETIEYVLANIIHPDHVLTAALGPRKLPESLPIMGVNASLSFRIATIRPLAVYSTLRR